MVTFLLVCFAVVVVATIVDALTSIEDFDPVRSLDPPPEEYERNE
jgi:hypothetical protein